MTQAHFILDYSQLVGSIPLSLHSWLLVGFTSLFFRLSSYDQGFRWWRWQRNENCLEWRGNKVRNVVFFLFYLNPLPHCWGQLDCKDHQWFQNEYNKAVNMNIRYERQLFVYQRRVSTLIPRSKIQFWRWPIVSGKVYWQSKAHWDSGTECW